MLEALLESSRNTKRAILLVYDVCAITMAVYIAACLRLGTFNLTVTSKELTALAITIVVTLILFIRLGMYRAILRYMDMPAMITIIGSISISGVVLATASFLTYSAVPRSVPFIYIMVSLVLIGGARLIMRSIILLLIRQSQGVKEPVIVYGAGYTGHQLSQALLNTPYKVIAFVDDARPLHGTSLGNIKVYGPDMIQSLMRSHGVTKVLLALGNTPSSRRAAVIKRLEHLQVEVLTVPALSDIVSGKARIEQVRDVDIEDLLGRDSVEANPELMHACITGKVVMVTGAGGSIGSELCRQIIRQAPAKLILVELNEFSLYAIEQELQQELSVLDFHPSNLVCLIGSVQNERRMESIMRAFGVQTVYHSAAFKHVPLVESNVIEGVSNNIFGTWYCAEAAIRAEVESFVLISTDKAVRPTNIMGASKRMAELVLQGLSQRQNVTRFVIVRFGNVLGSSGSVVPLFRQQLKSGGPITVTHPEIIRYFMTIPEAASLVIQAGSMGAGGDVFVLDMGEPVKIVDLAMRMIHLAGLSLRDEQHPTGDIAIEYTGLRAGEKLYEELLIGDDVSGTDHPRIMRAREQSLDWKATKALLDELYKYCDDYQCAQVKELLKNAPTGYSSDEPLSDALWLHSQRTNNKLRLIS